MLAQLDGTFSFVSTADGEGTFSFVGIDIPQTLGDLYIANDIGGYRDRTETGLLAWLLRLESCAAVCLLSGLLSSERWRVGRRVCGWEGVRVEEGRKVGGRNERERRYVAQVRMNECVHGVCVCVCDTVLNE